ncbi:MAG: histidine utilization repressor [Pseudomonadota bacterium]|nr:histidine utilization repressor [Pseudomonadota bacterium]
MNKVDVELLGPKGRAREPRYAAIKQYIQHALSSGALKPGDRVPSEAELVVQFEVSRMTANRALRELQAAGAVVRRAGIGSFVAEPTALGHMIEIRNIADDIRARGHDYRAQVIENVATKASTRTGSLLGVLAGTRIFHSIIVHHEADVPIQLEERYVVAAIAPDYDRIDFTLTTPNEYLTRIAPIEKVEHRVKAIMPDPVTRRLLELSDDQPALLMMRHTWSRNQLVSYALLTHPGNRFELSASFAVPTA